MMATEHDRGLLSEIIAKEAKAKETEIQDIQRLIRDFKEWIEWIELDADNMEAWEMVIYWRAVYYLENYLEKLQEEYERIGGTKK